MKSTAYFSPVHKRLPIPHYLSLHYRVPSQHCMKQSWCSVSHVIMVTYSNLLVHTNQNPVTLPSCTPHIVACNTRMCLHPLEECMRVCAHWRSVCVFVPTGGVHVCLCPLEECMCVCAHWRSVCVFVPTGGVYVCLCPLEECMCVCAHWRSVCVFVPTGGVYVHMYVSTVVRKSCSFSHLSLNANSS